MAVTYDTLVADTPRVLMGTNTSLVADMPLVIRQAEDELIERLDHDAFRSLLNDTFVVQTDVRTIDLSGQASAVFEVRALRIDYNGIPVVLERRDIERISMVYRDFDLGVPRFYAEDDSPLVLKVFPNPDTAYTVRVFANVMPARLDGAVQQSLLTTGYPRLLEMMVLKHGARYLRNKTDEARYGAEVDLALTAANAQLARRRRDETAIVTQTTANRVG